MNQIIKQIEFILSVFNNKDQKPALWNVDTDYINTLKRLIYNLKENNITEIREVATKKIENSNRFDLYINNIKITPTTNHKIGVSCSAIRQYLQFLSSFNWIIFSKFEKEWFKHNSYVFKTNITINKLLTFEEKDFYSLLVELIINGSVSYLKHQSNLAYSLFLYYIYNQNEKLFKEINFLEPIRKIVKKENKKYFLPNDVELENYLKHHKSKKNCLSNTYYQSYEILKNNNFNFNELINYIYQEIMIRYPNIIENQSVNVYSNKYIQIKENINDIQSKRGLLRQNIIANRFDVNNPPTYSDIIDLKTNQMIIRAIDVLEACHIYEINQIKNNFLKNEKFELKECNDYNNGLMMPKDYHYYFDRQVIKIDLDGNSIFEEEFINDLKLCNIEPFKINPKTFTDQMKEYFIKRYN